MAKLRASFTYLFLVAVIAFLPAGSYGRPAAIANDASVAEAVDHVAAWIKVHPNDAAGYRTLAHIHALAWAYGEQIPLVGNVGPDALPQFAESSTILVSRTAPREDLWMSHVVAPGDRQDRPITASDAKNLLSSIAAYRKAIELNAGDALSELGLGWMLAQQGIYARQLPADCFEELKSTDTAKANWGQAIKQLANDNYQVREAASKALVTAMPACVLVLRDVKTTDPEVNVRIDAVFNTYYQLRALDHYRKAFDLQAQADLAGQPTYQVDSQVSARAGTQILAVLAVHPEAARKGEAQAVEDVTEKLAKQWQTLMMMPQ